MKSLFGPYGAIWRETDKSVTFERHTMRDIMVIGSQASQHTPNTPPTNPKPILHPPHTSQPLYNTARIAPRAVRGPYCGKRTKPLLSRVIACVILSLWAPKPPYTHPNTPPIPSLYPPHTNQPLHNSARIAMWLTGPIGADFPTVN